MAGQVGFKSEATYGTAVVVDQFVPVKSASVVVDEGLMRPKGIRATRRTANPGVLGQRKINGTVDLELPNVTIATLLKHLFGAVATTGAGPYTHTYTPGAHLAKSLTLQVGITDAGDTVRPFTAAGVKVNAWKLACVVGDFADLSMDWTASTLLTGTALASASYASGLTPFTFVNATVTVNGSSVASAKGVTLSATKNLRSDRYALGSRAIREQLEETKFDFMSEITADFDDLTLFALGVAGTQVASVLTFDNGTNTLTITTSGQVTGDPPSLASNGLEGQTVKLTHSHATADASAITAVLVSSTESSAA